jgi:hypothetical protein
MITETPGPERARLGFVEEVIAAFDFLTSEYGFRLVKAEVTFVRYETPEVFVNIYHGRASYELGVEIGCFADTVDSAERHYSLVEIIELASAKAESGYTFYQASTPERVKTWVLRLAALVRKYADKALQGDALTFEQLREVRSRLSHEYLTAMKLRRIREQVNKAWQAKDYAKVVELYEQVRDDLSPAEQKKLEYARKHL